MSNGEGKRYVDLLKTRGTLASPSKIEKVCGSKEIIRKGQSTWRERDSSPKVKVSKNTDTLSQEKY